MQPAVCVVGGGGHVGTPLALMLAAGGFPVLIYDVDRPKLEQLAAGRMPHREAGGEELLARVLDADMLRFTNDPAGVAGTPHVILAVAPPDGASEPSMPALLTAVLDDLLPHLADDTCIVVRSTIAPGTTEALQRHLRSRGKDALLAYCPERAVEGRAIAEMPAIAQIVSGVQPEAVRRARALFAPICAEIVEMSVLEAEYAKLICNAYRYVQFATANALCAIVESAGLDYAALRGKMQAGYPRMAGLPRAGFAGGPCLSKDVQQLIAAAPGGFALGSAALEVNESVPERVVANLERRTQLAGKRVGILGTAFKAESDDARQSHSYALGALLRARGALVSYSDEYVGDPDLVAKEELLATSDAIVIAIPHTAYRGLRFAPEAIVVDTCGCLGA